MNDPKPEWPQRGDSKSKIYSPLATREDLSSCSLGVSMGERGARAGSSQGSPLRGWLAGWPVPPTPPTPRDEGTSQWLRRRSLGEGDQRQAGGCGVGSPRPGSPPGGWAGGKGLGCRAGGTEPGCLLSTARTAAAKLLDPPRVPAGSEV